MSTILFHSLFAASLFAQPWLLLWCFAAILPVLIHFLLQRRRETLDWGAMQFLAETLRSRSRAIRIEQWILWMIRAAALALLGVTLARPVSPWIKEKSPGQATPQSRLIVLVLDYSYSMVAASDAGTVWRSAQEQAVRVVNQGSEGGHYLLYCMSETVRDVISEPTLDRDAVINEIEQLRPLDAKARLEPMLSALEAIVVESKGSKSIGPIEVVFISDFDATCWGEAISGDINRRLVELGERVAMRSINVATPITTNLAITRVECRQPVITTPMDIDIEVDVANLGTRNVSEQVVELRVNGSIVDLRSVSLKPNEQQTLRKRHVVTQRGAIQISARTSGDQIEPDNHRSAVIEGRPPIKVIIIEGVVDSSLSIVDAFAATLEAGPSYRSQVVLADQIDQIKLTDFDIVVMNNVGEIDQSLAHGIREFLREGNILFCFLGDQVRVSDYNRHFVSGASRVLPLRLTEQKNVVGVPLDMLDFRHPVLSVYRGLENVPLGRLPIQKLVSMTQPRGAAADPVSTIFRLQTGEPVYLHHQCEGGHVFLCTTAASGKSVTVQEGETVPWSYLDVWPSLLPLIHESVGYSHSEMAQLSNVVVGAPAVLFLKPASTTASVMAEMPDKSQRAMVVPLDSNDHRWEFPDTWHQGFYRFTAQPENNLQVVAVNVDVAESSHDRIELEQLPDVISSENNKPPSLADGYPRWPAYRILLIAIVVLLVGEGWYARRLGGT